MKLFRIKIGNSMYLVSGRNIETLKRYAQTVGLKYESIRPANSDTDGLIKVRTLAELIKYLDKCGR